jgi:hypothetical protein
MLRSSLGVVTILAVAGCSSANLSFDPLPSKEPEPEPDYQKLVASSANTNLKDRVSFGPLEISPIRRTRLTEPGDWMVCAKTTVRGHDAYFGAFIQEHQVIAWRQAVLIDECEKESYQPL